MNLRGKDAWEQAALALAAGDRAALGTVLPRLPAAAAQAIAAAAERSIRPLRNAAAVPAGVEWIGDSRFAAIFARERATVRWSLPGRELGDAAEFRLSPGECRFFILREGADA